MRASAEEKLGNASQEADPQEAMKKSRSAAKALLDALLAAFGNGLAEERAARGLDKDKVPADAADKTYWDALNAGDEVFSNVRSQWTA